MLGVPSIELLGNAFISGFNDLGSLYQRHGSAPRLECSETLFDQCQPESQSSGTYEEIPGLYHVFVSRYW